MSTNEEVSYEQTGIISGFLQNKGDWWIFPDEWRKENYIRIKNKWEWNKREISKFLIVDKKETENDINGTFNYLKMSLLI